ncbi:alpha/beta fold hydrolase [uncultured Sphingomonas sp.]|uniref:alpha/beta fold hydrolase n=1 Tax=uncultured Sphingomonas sp. TaxID=158754 RepID=UPI0035CBD25E
MKQTLWAALVLAACSGTVLAQNMRPRDVDALPAFTPTLVAAYGNDPLQVGELRLPAGKGPFPVVEVVHGGCWTKGFATRKNTAALASALTAMGYATWNIEYRQVGDPGGGWPGTFKDWAAATDYLRVLAKSQPISLKRVAVVGHSAGAHAALWIASRASLPAASDIGSEHPLPVSIAVAIDGPGELASFVGADAEICGKPVIAPLIGGLPKDQLARYRLASPFQNLPTSAQEYLIASVVLTADAAEHYRTVAATKGQVVRVLNVKNGGHFDIIAPDSAAWKHQVEPFVATALRETK